MSNWDTKYMKKPIGAYGEVERLYRQKVKEREAEIENMRLKKEREVTKSAERVQKEKERVEKYLEEEAKKSRAKIIEEREKKIAQEARVKKLDKIALESRVKKELHNKLFESYYGTGSEDEILQNKKLQKKYLFIYQIEDEGLQTEQLTGNEIEERLDKFGLSGNNYVIIDGGKVVGFPLNNNLKP